MMDDSELKKLNAVDALNNRVQLLETEGEKKIRLTSLRIIYFTMFLMTLGFSIILTGIWPYLDKVRMNTIFLSYQHLTLVIEFSSLTKARARSLWATLWQRIHSDSSFFRQSSDGGRTNLLRYERRLSCR